MGEAALSGRTPIHLSKGDEARPIASGLKNGKNCLD
jgi:hypothetical protein